MMGPFVVTQEGHEDVKRSDMKTLKGVLVVLGFVFPRSLPVFTADEEKEKQPNKHGSSVIVLC